jgi:phospholipid/cholesterol/gamma-HCH transport system substrate-binding protein
MQQNKLETRIGIFIIAASAIFLYMGFQIGSFRFDRANYNTYFIFFEDVSGLSRKSVVKIAGVNTGWVEAVILVDAERQVKTKIMIKKEYILHEDAYAIVRQDGLLGSKYIEIIPGDPLLPTIESGTELGKPSVAPVSIDELLHQVQRITTNIQDVSETLKESIGGEHGRERIDSIVKNVSTVAQQMVDVSGVLERTIAKNEDSIDAFLDIGNQFKRLSDRLDEKVLPSFQESVEKISDVFDRDFSRVADSLESSVSSIEEASAQARDGFKEISNVAQKIAQGEGLIGKLVNEDALYKDIKVAAGGLKNYMTRMDKLQVIFDGHTEGMHRPSEYYGIFEDAKAYIEMRIHPHEDYFFLLQLVGSERGFVERFKVDKTYENDEGQVINPDKLALSDNDRLENVFAQSTEIFTRNSYRFGLQIGKIFGPIAFRVGIFDGFGGFAVDFDIPFPTDKFRWITSIEGFDFRGFNRHLDRIHSDRRPHFKWINRMFFIKNLYAVFGADDFVSKRNASIFAGFGLRFGDSSFKYLLPSIASTMASADTYTGKTVCINS